MHFSSNTPYRMLKQIFPRSKQLVATLHNIRKQSYQAKYTKEYYLSIFESISLDVIKNECTLKEGEKKTRVTIIGFPIFAQDLDASVEQSYLEDPAEENVITFDPTHLIYLTRSIAKKNGQKILHDESWDPLYPFSIQELILNDQKINSIIMDPNFNPEPLSEEEEGHYSILASGLKDPAKRKGAYMLFAKLQQIINYLAMREPSKVARECFYPLYRLSLINHNDLILGGIPKALSRLCCATWDPVEDVRWYFTNQIKDYCKTKANKREFSIVGGFANLSNYVKFTLPGVYLFVEDLYCILLLKELAKGAKHIKVITTDHQAKTLFDMLEDDSLRLPTDFDSLVYYETIANETIDTLIEKHAMLEVLHEDLLWIQPYITDKFPYISQEHKKLIGVTELQRKFDEKYQHYFLLKMKLMEGNYDPKDS